MMAILLQPWCVKLSQISRNLVRPEHRFQINVLKSRAKYGSDSAVLCANFQNDLNGK